MQRERNIERDKKIDTETDRDSHRQEQKLIYLQEE